MIEEPNRNPEMGEQMEDGGFEMVGIALERIPAFMAERSREYMEIARHSLLK